MRKTSVYLPDALKDDARARWPTRWGRSEAELIRLAIERLVRSGRRRHGRHAAAPPGPGAPGPRLVGVGVGPGDPDLLTERAVDVLRAADRVFAASDRPRRHRPGRGHRPRRPLPDVAVDRLVFDMAAATTARDGALDAAAGRARRACSTAGERGRLRDPRRPQRVLHVPVAGRAGGRRAPGRARRDGARDHGLPGAGRPHRHRRWPTATSGWPWSRLRRRPERARRRCSPTAEARSSLYKGGRHLPELAERLAARGRLDGAVVGELLGLPGERLGPVADVGRPPGSLPGHRHRARRGRAGRGGPVVISFVGAGPGAADLITLRGAQRLAAADVVVWAASLVPAAVLDALPARRRASTTPRRMTLEEVTAVYAAHPEAAIVRLHSGDPAVYGAIAEQIDWCVAHERAFEIVPGVTSLAAAAAAARAAS